MEDRIIRTCKSLPAVAAVAALLLPTPALALARSSNAARTYLEARAAAIDGNHSRAAQLLARLVDTSAANQTVTKQALSQAISAGDMKLALRLVRGLPAAETPIEARMLQVAEALRSNDGARALALLQDRSEAGDLGFVRPFVQAWTAADDNDQERALAALNGISSGNLLAALAPENRALILLKFRRTAEAQPLVDQVLKTAAGRESRLRFAFASAYLSAGDRARAAAVLNGLGTGLGRSGDRVLQGKPGGVAIDLSQFRTAAARARSPAER